MNTTVMLFVALAAFSFNSARLHHRSRWRLSIGPFSIALSGFTTPLDIPRTVAIAELGEAPDYFADVPPSEAGVMQANPLDCVPIASSRAERMEAADILVRSTLNRRL